MSYRVLTVSVVNDEVTTGNLLERFDREVDARTAGDKFIMSHNLNYGAGGLYEAEKSEATYEVVREWFKQWPTIAVPDFIRTGGWEDWSYGNDSCGAAFLPLSSYTNEGLRLWVEHRDRRFREEPTHGRFCLQYVSDHEDGWNDGSAEDLWEGEDEAECLAAIEMAKEKNK
jgi:hypothetical protein